jgi:hypothetical protein
MLSTKENNDHVQGDDKSHHAVFRGMSLTAFPSTQSFKSCKSSFLVLISTVVVE